MQTPPVQSWLLLIDMKGLTMKKRMVVVTTDKDRRGVFFGELKEQDEAMATCILLNARMCVRWSMATHGVLGLAGRGPQSGSRITPQVPRIELNGVTAIMDCTPEAASQWETELWA